MDKIGDLLNRLVTVNPNAKELVVPNSKYKREILKILFEEGWIAGITEKDHQRSCERSSLPKGREAEIDSNNQKQKAQIYRSLVVYLKRPYVDASNVNWNSVNLKVTRISKPGRRIYCTAKELKKINYKLTNIASTLIISTNKGVMTVTKAVSLNVGGELLFKISTS